jgi:hypothetical protein
MKGLLYVLALCLVAAVAVWAYKVNYRTLATLERVETLRAQIAGEHEAMDILAVKWAYLNAPDRLARLAAAHLPELGLEAFSPAHYAEIGLVAFPPPPPLVANAAPMRLGPDSEAAPEMGPDLGPEMAPELGPEMAPELAPEMAPEADVLAGAAAVLVAARAPAADLVAEAAAPEADPAPAVAAMFRMPPPRPAMRPAAPPVALRPVPGDSRQAAVTEGAR